MGHGFEHEAGGMLPCVLSRRSPPRGAWGLGTKTEAQKHVLALSRGHYFHMMAQLVMAHHSGDEPDHSLGWVFMLALTQAT